MRDIFRALFLTTALAAPVAAGAQETRAEASDNPFSRINHIVVVAMENRSFDYIFGLFPGAEGVEAAARAAQQVDRDGKQLPRIPLPGGAGTRSNAPFLIDDAAAADERVDPTHHFYVEQEQIDDGRMDRFAEASNAGGAVMAYRDGSALQAWALAREFTLADHFFHSAYGGSMLNHFFLVCACAPTYRNAPERLVALLDGEGRLQRKDDSPESVLDGPPRWRREGKVTPDGFAFGTFIPFAKVGPIGSDNDVLPAQDAPTIGDRLDDRQVSWAWYAGGWDDVMSGRTKPYAGPDRFQSHHQPFLFFSKYGPDSPARTRHLKDEKDLLEDARRGTLPQVAFYKPVGRHSEHPTYAPLDVGDAHLGEVIAQLRRSPNWRDMLIIVTADENGGYWDHVAPPKIDRFGPGARVPAIIISPFARKGFVDKTVYESASILRTIETRFGLPSLGARDAAAADLRNALEPVAR